MNSIHGMIVPLITLLRDAGEIDVPGFKRPCEIQIQSGIHILFVLGTTGEFYGLTPQQRREVVETAVDTASGRVPVIVGISGDSTASTLSALDLAWHGGVSAYVVSTPYFLTYTQTEFLDYFREIADTVGEAVILYNYPARFGHVIEVDTIETLVKERRVFGIKDTPAISNTCFVSSTSGILSLHSASSKAPCRISPSRAAGVLTDPCKPSAICSR